MIGVVSRCFSVVAVMSILTSCGADPFLFKDDYNKFTNELKSFHSVGTLETDRARARVIIKEVANTKTDKRVYYVLMITGYNYKNEPHVNFKASKPLHLLVDGKPFGLPVREETLTTFNVIDPSVEIIHGYEITPGYMTNSHVEYKKGMALAVAEYPITLDLLNKLKKANNISMMYYLTDCSSGNMGSFTKKHIEKLQSFKPMNISEKLEALNKTKKK